MMLDCQAAGCNVECAVAVRSRSECRRQAPTRCARPRTVADQAMPALQRPGRAVRRDSSWPTGGIDASQIHGGCAATVMHASLNALCLLLYCSSADCSLRA